MDSQSVNVESPLTVVRPSSGWVPLKIADLWTYRELLYFLVWKDIKVRYKQTTLGIFWAVIQPVLVTIAFTIFLGKLTNLSPNGLPYPLFVFCGLLPWQLFSYVLSNASNSLVVNESLISKVYFPRLLIPLSAALSGLIDFAVTFLVLLGMIVYYDLTLSLTLFAMPLLLILTLAIAVGVGLWLSALNVEYRDVRYTVPFITQLWFFLSPVIFPSNLLSEPGRTWYALNPLVGVIEGFRWVLLGQSEGVVFFLATSIPVTAIILIGGLYYFRRMERRFADIV
jgi:lipopolysaccharide transport system permease protein